MCRARGSYAKGPLVAYSHPVASALVPRLTTDEAAALNRNSRPLLDRYGSLTAPGVFGHPARSIVYDDVYYSALVSELFATRDMLLEARRCHTLACSPRLYVQR